MYSDQHISRLIQIARLYYTYSLNQQQIADKLGISRPGVSRLLQEARDKGIVQIEIVDIGGSSVELEKSLEEKFGLKKAVVVPNEGISGEEGIKQRLGIAAAQFLDTCIHEGTILGVSWGTTMQELVRHLRPRRVKDMTVVQIIGGIARAEFDIHSSEIVQKISENFKAIPYLLPTPTIVDDIRVKEAMLSEKRIANVLNLGKQAEIAIFSVGILNHDCLLMKAEYFKKNEVDDLLEKKAVGDITSRIVTDTGDICSLELDSRTIGIELADLRQKPYSIAVAGGLSKLPIILAGLLGRYYNVLITDEEVAVRLIEHKQTGIK